MRNPSFKNPAKKLQKHYSVTWEQNDGKMETTTNKTSGIRWVPLQNSSYTVQMETEFSIKMLVCSMMETSMKQGNINELYTQYSIIQL
jgi:hypothetical protein